LTKLKDWVARKHSGFLNASFVLLTRAMLPLGKAIMQADFSPIAHNHAGKLMLSLPVSE